jgi:hypothetical protein
MSIVSAVVRNIPALLPWSSGSFSRLKRLATCASYTARHHFQHPIDSKQSVCTIDTGETTVGGAKSSEQCRRGDERMFAGLNPCHGPGKASANPIERFTRMNTNDTTGHYPTTSSHIALKHIHQGQAFTTPLGSSPKVERNVRSEEGKTPSRVPRMRSG